MWAAMLVVLTAEVLRFRSADAMLRLNPLVQTQAGLIRGLRADDGKYAMFLGIPYAQVQGNNPFGVSVPQPKFHTVFNALNDSAICPQVEEFGNTIVGTLDCLHLNIFVPNKASSRSRLPVLVWIYGGGFSIGFFNRFVYGPKYLVRHDVILVTLNYRLGPYGFFCLNTPEVPGNQGIKDQLLALRWIKNNIASFGGDVNKITLMGQSAGATSIECHLLSKGERLFNQVILQSGSTFIPGRIEKPDESKPLRIAERLGFATKDVSAALTYLAETDVKSVIAAAKELSITSSLCVEQKFENVDSILNDYPINLNMPKVRNIPVLAGFNSQELLLVYALTPVDTNVDIFETSLQQEYVYDEELKKDKDILRRFYIGDEDITDALRWKLTDFRSDYTYNFPVQLSLKKYLENCARDVYYYMFSYNGDRNFVKKRFHNTEKGASHADEIGYLFDLSYEKDVPSAEDQLMIDRITTLWTNFAKYGDPTPKKTELLPVNWIPITRDTYTYLNIDRELSVARRPYNDRMAFWELFYDVNKSKRKGYRPK